MFSPKFNQPLDIITNLQEIQGTKGIKICRFNNVYVIML